MTRKKALNIIKNLKKKYGNVESGLSYKNLFQLAISVVLSAQTTDVQVNSVTPALFKKYPDFRGLALGRISDVEKIIRSVGLYKTKARNIVRLSGDIVKKFNGRVPEERDELVKLPGIGRKSANVILAFGYGKNAFPVDTHVKRVAYRLGFGMSADPLAIEKSLTSCIPEKQWRTAHLLLINHGRRICAARNPRCPECPVTGLCPRNGVQGNIS